MQASQKLPPSPRGKSDRPLPVPPKRLGASFQENTPNAVREHSHTVSTLPTRTSSQLSHKIIQNPSQLSPRDIPTQENQANLQEIEIHPQEHVLSKEQELYPGQLLVQTREHEIREQERSEEHAPQTIKETDRTQEISPRTVQEAHITTEVSEPVPEFVPFESRDSSTSGFVEPQSVMTSSSSIPSTSTEVSTTAPKVPTRPPVTGRTAALTSVARLVANFQPPPKPLSIPGGVSTVQPVSSPTVSPPLSPSIQPVQHNTALKIQAQPSQPSPSTLPLVQNSMFSPPNIPLPRPPSLSNVSPLTELKTINSSAPAPTLLAKLSGRPPSSSQLPPPPGVSSLSPPPSRSPPQKPLPTLPPSNNKEIVAVSASPLQSDTQSKDILGVEEPKGEEMEVRRNSVDYADIPVPTEVISPEELSSEEDELALSTPSSQVKLPPSEAKEPATKAPSKPPLTSSSSVSVILRSSDYLSKSRSSTVAAPEPRRSTLTSFLAPFSQIISPQPSSVSVTTVSAPLTSPRTELPAATVVFNSGKEELSRRDRIVKEILTTEDTYVRSLNHMIKTLLLPLRSLDPPLLSAEILSGIFMNVEEIASFNGHLLTQLQSICSNWSEDQRIGEFFKKMVPFFKSYFLYAANSDTALQLLSEAEKNPNFSSILKEWEQLPETRSLPLRSYLILPIQRIPRYNLLLKDLLHHTDESHPDYANIFESNKKIQEIAAAMNESIKASENRRKILSIQNSITTMGYFGNEQLQLVAPHRLFIKEGTVMKQCRKTVKPRYLFLFNDILVYCAITLGNYVHSGTLPLLTLRLDDIADTDKLQNAWKIISPKKSFVVFCESKELKFDWLGAIAEAVNEEKKKRETLRKKDTTKNSDGYEAPVWVPDSEVTNCPICSSEFSFLTRKHHCRLCGQVVCAGCSTARLMINGAPERVCALCFALQKQQAGITSSSSGSSFT